MKCPICGEAMERGEITGDGRAKVRWLKAGMYPSALDKALSDPGRGHLMGVQYKPFVGFLIEAGFCHRCKKMIFDTDIEK